MKQTTKQPNLFYKIWNKIFNLQGNKSETYIDTNGRLRDAKGRFIAKNNR